MLWVVIPCLANQMIGVVICVSELVHKLILIYLFFVLISFGEVSVDVLP